MRLVVPSSGNASRPEGTRSAVIHPVLLLKVAPVDSSSSKPLTEMDLQAIEQRLRECTPGPWRHRMLGFIETAYEPWHIIGVTCRQQTSQSEPLPSVQNAEFIAHAREDVPLLINEIRRLRQRLRELTNET